MVESGKNWRKTLPCQLLFTLSPKVDGPKNSFVLYGDTLCIILIVNLLWQNKVLFFHNLFNIN